MAKRNGETGIALVLCLLAILLLMAVGSALVITSSVETRIAGNYNLLIENGDAAVAALERALEDVPADAGWDTLLSGTALSSFADGPPAGARTLPDGSTLNLTQFVNVANCGRTTTCTDSQMNAVTPERPWGPNNPRWRLFAFGSLNSLLTPGRIEAHQYLVVLLGDDPSESDGDPLTDAGPGLPGNGVIALRAEAFGPASSHSGVSATLRRGVPAKLLSLHDLARLDRP